MSSRVSVADGDTASDREGMLRDWLALQDRVKRREGGPDREADMPMPAVERDREADMPTPAVERDREADMPTPAVEPDREAVMPTAKAEAERDTVTPTVADEMDLEREATGVCPVLSIAPLLESLAVRLTVGVEVAVRETVRVPDRDLDCTGVIVRQKIQRDGEIEATEVKPTKEE